ncbi:MAG: C39 family peptidase [Planctomycetes bacterium]|nr:C39 family peptidase [Planctomycetota bacterium]
MSDSTLNIPYLSQVDDPGARQFANDCGPASVAMVLAAFDKLGGDTINALYKQTGNKKDSYTGYGQLSGLLRKRGISAQQKINMSRGQLFELLQEGRPVIVLVDYEYLKPAKPESGFRGQHFFVVIGFDIKSVIVNDPLWRGEGGKAWAIPWEVFDKAWEEAIPERSALIIYDSLYGLFDTFGDDTGDEFPVYTIITGGLNVRSDPGVRNPLGRTNRIVGAVYYGYKETVYETRKIAAGNQLWGRIGDNRWIALEYHGRTYAEIK